MFQTMQPGRVRNMLHCSAFAVACITQPWRQCSANHLEECWQFYNLATIKSSVTLGEEREWLVSKPLCIWPNVNRCLSPGSKSCWQQTQWHNIYNIVIAFRQLYEIWFEIEHKLCEKREKMNERGAFQKKMSVKHMLLHSPLLHLFSITDVKNLTRYFPLWNKWKKKTLPSINNKLKKSTQIELFWLYFIASSPIKSPMSYIVAGETCTVHFWFFSIYGCRHGVHKRHMHSTE